MEILKSKRFVVRKSLIGSNQIIEVTFKNGKVFKYDHDQAYNAMSEKLNAMPCWEKYKSYTSSSSIPTAVRPVLIDQSYNNLK